MAAGMVRARPGGEHGEGLRHDPGDPSRGSRRGRGRPDGSGAAGANLPPLRARATSPHLEFGQGDFDSLSQARYQVTYGLWEVGGRRAVFFVAAPSLTNGVKDGAGEPTVLIDPMPKEQILYFGKYQGETPYVAEPVSLDVSETSTLHNGDYRRNVEVLGTGHPTAGEPSGRLAVSLYRLDDSFKSGSAPSWLTKANATARLQRKLSDDRSKKLVAAVPVRFLGSTVAPDLFDRAFDWSPTIEVGNRRGRWPHEPRRSSCSIQGASRDRLERITCP